MKHSSRAGRFAIALAFVMLCSVAGAGAADKPSKDAAAKPGSLLTPAQVRECMTQKQSLHSQTDDALKDKAAIEADKQAIAGAENELSERLKTLDKTKAEEIDSYNAKIGERDKLVESYQAKVPAYNAKVEALKTTKAAYETSCENRKYDERLLDDPKRKK